MKEIELILEKMEPRAALDELVSVIKGLLTHLSEEYRIKFVTALLEESSQDKVASMVNL